MTRVLPIATNLHVSALKRQIQTPLTGPLGQSWQDFRTEPTSPAHFRNLDKALRQAGADRQQRHRLRLIWRARLTTDWKLPDSQAKQVYDAEVERPQEKAETNTLHGEWLEHGGRLLIRPDERPQEILPLLLAGESIIKLGGMSVFDSERWGPIDLSRLNQGAEAYPGNLGQASLFRDLAIVLDRYYLGVQNSRSYWGPSPTGKNLFRRLKWHNIVIDWRHFFWRYLRTDWSDYHGEAGYDRFTLEYFDGESLKAWRAAAALLTPDQFAELQWPKQKISNVNDQAELRRILRAGIRDRSLIGEEGYNNFALEHFKGNAEIAWVVASTLLNRDEFEQLQWGKARRTHVKDHDRIRNILRQGYQDESLTGRKGYIRFAKKYCEGNCHKAWLIASSLLPKEEFLRLKWRRQIPLHASEIKPISQVLRKGLKDGSYCGTTGYRQCSDDLFAGNQVKAAQVASALLSQREVKALGWGHQKQIDVADEPRLITALLMGITAGHYLGDAGYDRFALDFFHGRKKKAWEVARALLSEKEFRKLGWGRQQKKNLPWP